MANADADRDSHIALYCMLNPKFMNSCITMPKSAMMSRVDATSVTSAANE